MNWVENRQDCNAVNALAQLLSEAKENVKTRCKQLRDSGQYMPGCVGLPQERGFQVIRNGETVSFELLDLRTIRVSEKEKNRFDVHVHMEPGIRCVLMVDGKELEPWEVLYKALDKLLF